MSDQTAISGSMHMERRTMMNKRMHIEHSNSHKIALAIISLVLLSILVGIVSATPDPHQTGVKWDPGVSSSTVLTRVDSDGNTVTSVPSFDNQYPWSQMGRVNNSDMQYQTMVWIPLFYDKVIDSGTSHTYMIWNSSDFTGAAAAGFEPNPAFIINGTTVPGIYFSAYQGDQWNATYGYRNDTELTSSTAYPLNTASDLLTSVPNVKPVSGQNLTGLTLPAFRSLAQNRGVGWELQTYWQVSAIEELFYVEYANLNGQAALGPGVSQITDDGKTNMAMPTGITASCGNASCNLSATHYQTGQATDQISYRGIEAFWANIYTWADGLNTRDNIPWVADHAYASSTYSVPYVNSTVKLSTSNGWAVNTTYSSVLKRGFLPTTSSGGSATTYLADYYNQAAGNVAALFGGGWLSGLLDGPAFWNLDGSAALVNRRVGGRISYIPPVYANFTSTVAGNTATFTDTSYTISTRTGLTGTPTSWNWSFGDGTYSGNQNPSHTYSAIGTYTVTLTSAYSASSSIYSSNVTISAIPPAASFTANQTTGASPLAVQFTDTSTNSPTSWYWVLSDGTTATAQNLTHTFAAGNWTVNLTVSNAAGSNTSALQWINVSLVNPNQNSLLQYKVGTSSSQINNGTPYVGTGTARNITSNTTYMYINQTWDPTYVAVSNIRTNTSAANIPGLTISTSEVHNDKGFALINLSKPSGFTSPANALYDFNISFVNYAPNGTTARFSFDNSSRYYDPVNATWWPFTYINGADAVLGAWPPVANFTGTPTTGTIPLAVSFTDTSTNYPTSWYWIFGDGNTSTGQNPSHQYLISGLYDVDLRVTNAAGSAWLNRTAYINASQIVVTSSGTPTSGQIPLTVNFTGSATGSGDFTYYWLFGDGNTSTSQNPSHTYSAVGIYDVSLRVNESITGSIIWSNHTAYINASDSRPIANFTGTPTSGTVPLAVSFTDTSTLSPTSWNWSFGDGGTSTLQNPTHVYNSVGVYEVDLQAGNSFGTNWSNKTGYINVTSMVATSSGTPTTGATPLTVTFTGSATGSPDQYYWSFGDGNTSAVQNPSHTYVTIGVYDISFRATNTSSGAFAWANHTAYVNATTPPTIANFTGTPQSGIVPLSVQFTDTSTNISTSWYWVFGDGSTSTLQSPLHTYSSVGIYDVSFEATNAAGSTWSNKTGYINVTPMVATSNGTPTSGQIPLTVNFTGSSTGSPDAYYWDFGDGNTSTSQNPVYTYSIVGVYNVSFKATNTSSGAFAWANHTSYINAIIPPPVTSFTGTPTSGIVPVSVQFTDASSNSPTSWYWVFGDGSTSTDQNPLHTYTASGLYNVDLKATNPTGSNWSNVTSYINVSPMEATSNGTPTSGYVPLTVTFTGSSTGSPDAYYWNFGDGATSTNQNPSHTYSVIGIYDVSFKATNTSSGAVAWANHTSYINAELPPPVVEFNGTPTSGIVPLTVAFADQSTNSPTSWYWIFGDGATSTSQNPVHTYAATGSYEVDLKATNPTGSNWTNKTSYITVTPMVATSSGTPTSGSVPLTVTFTGSSTGSPDQYYWSFGDGNTSTSQNPTYTYTHFGTYDVSFRATNTSSGAFAWANHTAYITVRNATPVASFTGIPTTGPFPLSVSFTDSSTNNPSSWSWSFGDGNTSALQNPTHSYAAEGTYTVSLTVANDGGSNTSTQTNYIHVTAVTPVANFTGTPTSGPYPLTVTFTDTSSNSPTSWLWSLGDGTTNTSQNVVHTYSSVGVYTVILNATNSGGTSSKTISNYINVTERTPVASFTASPTTGSFPLHVSFTDTSTNSPSSWLWNFGDSTTSTLQNPSHDYTTPGHYTVSLTATNTGGSNITTSTNLIYVTHVAPVASFTGTPTTGPFPLTVSFTDTSTNTPSNWSWSFGDGNTSTIQNPSHQYVSEGTYTVSLTVVNDGGTNTSTRNNYITVTAVTPVANFTGTPTSGSFPLAVSFTDTSTNSPTSWNWTFGDGSTSTVKNPSHTYTTAGTYTVSLTSANTGGSNTATKTNYINVTAVTPVANFTASPSSGTFPLAVSFTDTTTNAPTSWSWNFGDGNTSTLQNPSHTYTGAGNFTVTLTATNTGGSSSATHYVVVSTPSNAIRQDLAMAPYYNLVLSITNANTGAIISVVTVADSYGHSVNTTTGAFAGTYPYGPVSLTLTADGYYSQTVSYVMTADATYAITLTPVSSQSQNTNIIYTQQQVRFIVMNSEGTKVNGAAISASVVNSTLPSDSLTILEQAFGINANVAEIMLNGAEVMSGTTAGDGSLTFMMFPSLTYNLTITGVPAAPWYISVSPRETEYTIHQPTANATSSYSNYLNTSITITEPNSSYMTFNAVFQDLSGATTNVKYYVVYRPNNTIIYYRDMGNPGKSAVTDNSVTVPNIRGVTYWAYFNKTTV